MLSANDAIHARGGITGGATRHGEVLQVVDTHSAPPASGRESPSPLLPSCLCAHAADKPFVATHAGGLAAQPGLGAVSGVRPDMLVPFVACPGTFQINVEPESRAADRPTENGRSAPKSQSMLDLGA